MSGTEATLPKNSTEESASALESKGKGKAVVGNVHDDDVMDEDDEDDDDEEDDNEDDGLEEIDTNNIVEGGRRTRGQVIDFAKAAEENPADEDEDDEDDDFQPEEDTNMSG
ncbi:unnamed protein product [Clonostachys rosea f. rosea IK726]|uniref:Uncharacterized protein n=1 Tax=Clonostachys rosea f. rosea IK726 TaxID=1349383 RepID=A0ACA9TD83_BIOOC|nr:unnamed protein product [Clonostachys rosea f. rosea IK726]